MLIYNLITQNFSALESEKNFLQKCLCKEDVNIDKIGFVLENLITRKIDLNSCIAFVANIAGEQLPEGFDEDIEFLYGKLEAELKINISKENNADEIRKLFIAMSADIRIIMIKLFSLLYDINQYKKELTKAQIKVLNDVREIYAPLAERLGLNSLKANLEDCCLKLLNPKAYKNLEESVILHKENNKQQIDTTQNKLQNILCELNCKDCFIMARQKHFSSIYKKMQTDGRPLAAIYDLIALRVVVQTVEECYAVLGKIHAIYKPIEGRFKDYIAIPKPNGYQSLHTTIIAENGRAIEIQIRTADMHKECEFGVVSHWLYKEKRNKLSNLDKKFSWLREIMESEKDMSSEDFVETLKTNLCEGQIYVQTPKGKIIEFNIGATVLDFAYAIHSGVGNKCVGAKINGKIKPLSTKLETGDVVEILTNPNAKGPSKDWLKIVKTASAKSKINVFFKQEYREHNIKLGQTMLEQMLKLKGYVPNKILIDKYLAVENFKHIYKSIDDMLADIGHGAVSAVSVCNRLVAMYEDDHKSQEIELPKVSMPSVQIKRNKDGILIDGDSGMLIRYAGCCSPVFGEDIVGYISRGKGVTIHRAECHMLTYLEPERLIRAVWDEGTQNRISSVVLKITSSKSDNFLAKLTQTLLDSKYKILGLESKGKDLGKVATIVKIEVKQSQDVLKAIALIKDINSVEEVYRAGV